MSIPAVPQGSLAEHTSDALELSIVVGSVNAARSVDACLRSIENACKGFRAEIIVVDASDDETATTISAAHPDQPVERHPAGTLMPQLWSHGFARSRGRIVAFTTAHFSVGPDWARGIVSAIEGGATGVSGPLTLAPQSGVVDWAVFFLRYSAFADFLDGARESTSEIPGDNAAYDRRALERHSASFADGFWEVDFHRRVSAEGGRLAVVPEARASFGPSDSLLSFLKQRFGHGCHSGAWRVQRGIRSRWQVVVASPLVPFVLTARIGRRIVPRSADRIRFLRALPITLSLAAAWAAGEAWGALRGSDARQLSRTR